MVTGLAQRGVPLSRPKKVAADGNAQAWVEDPDGHLITFAEKVAG